jgi:putative transposase
MFQRMAGAERPNHVWAIDFQFDETADLLRLKLANIVDEYTREALAMRVGRSCTAEGVISSACSGASPNGTSAAPTVRSSTVSCMLED